MQWSQIVRRSIALFLTVITIWVVMLTTDMGTALEGLQALGENPVFVETALRAELGAPMPNAPTADMGFWQRLALGQSARLMAGILPEPTAPEPGPDTLPAEPEPAPVQEDHTLLPREVKAPEDIVPRTIGPGGNASAGPDGVLLTNETRSQTVDLTEIAAQEVTLTGSGAGPQILILHTHATEAYTMDGIDAYIETDPYRTIDTRRNMIRVGDELTRVFTEAGFIVLHDTGLYDYPQYNGAYTRSYAVVEEYLKKYPSISVVFDVHRDALVGTDGTVYKVVTDESLGAAAQVQIVAGTDEAGGTFPNWRENLAFAVRLQSAMQGAAPTLARPIALRRSHYNQQLSSGYLLLEVGSHGNTLQEALEAARLFARAAAPVIRGLL